MNWRLRAACAEKDPELFFPAGSGGRRQTEEAKAVCTSCPVRADCLQWSLTSRMEYGVWGGLTEDERRTLAHNEDHGG